MSYPTTSMKLFLLVIGLTLILEGFLPFFMPALYRRMINEIGKTETKIIRYGGFAAILLGLILMYFSKELL